MAMGSLETDYLVVGAGAMGMAFTDALIDHADVHVTLVDRRHAAGGHWQDAYPFVQLHQASLFYGVASTVLGSGAVQQNGPEAGLQERARQSEIQAYYDDILHRRFVGSGRVTFLGGSEYHTDGSSHLVTSLVSGETVEVDVRRRVVDATYLSPTIPATTPPPFGVADDVRVVAINELARLADAPSSYVIVGSGKTATDGIVWLLANGVQPDRIVWVRPRDPWMLNRAVVQPDPAVALGLAADTMAAAADAESLDDLFLRLEAAGVMLRIDTDVMPTMAKTPTLGAWELDLLRTHRERRSPGTHQARDRAARSSSTTDRSAGAGLARGALRRLRAAVPTAGSRLGTGQDPTPDDPGRLPVLLRGAGRLRGGDPRRRPRAQPVVSAEHPPRQPCRLGADAGSRNGRGAQLRRRAGHRRLGQRLRPEPRAHRTLATRRSRGAGRRRTSGRPCRARTRPHGGTRAGATREYLMRLRPAALERPWDLGPLSGPPDLRLV